MTHASTDLILTRMPGMALQGMPGMMVQGAGGQVIQNCECDFALRWGILHITNKFHILSLQATVQYSGQPTGPGGSRLVGFPGTAPSTVTSQVCLASKLRSQLN